MVKRIIAAILLLPLAEIIVFILVATLIGTGPALLAVLASTVAGLLVLRAVGRTGLAHFRGTVAGTPGGAARNLQGGAGGVFTVVAGLLLFVPGFLTSLVGVLLLIGPVRQACNRRFKQWLRRRQPSDPGTLDLKPGEWMQLPEHETSHENKPRRD
jgi:UPF0716 protein FxsA